MDSIVSIRNLHIEFAHELGTTEVVSDLSLEVERGQTTAIVGESGSGKSVTALALMRLIDAPGRISKGQILLQPDAPQPHYDVLELAPNAPQLYAHRGAMISMVFQEPMSSLSPVHTIGDQVTEALLTHQSMPMSEAEAIAVDMLEKVGIRNASDRLRQYPFEFSGGMRQRVCIAMALIGGPQVVICDEPTTALDVTIQAEILALIRSLKDRLNMTVIFITHDLAVVAQTADKVAVMHRGRLLEFGSVRQVLKDPLHPYTRALLQAVPGRNPGQRLQTVEELVDPQLLQQHCPLIDLPDGRRVSLTAEQLKGVQR